MPRPRKQLLALVNPRTPEGELKTPEQVWKELQAQVDATRADSTPAAESDR